MGLEIDIGFGPVLVSLAEVEDLAPVTLGFLAGLALQRVADPEAPREGWLRAAPSIAGVALLVALQVGSPTSMRWDAALTDAAAAALVLVPAAAVTLAQVAAAAAGRGRRAPLASAAPWARLALTLAGFPLALGYVPGRPPVHAATCILAVAAAGLLALARRRPLPGAALPFACANAASWIAGSLRSYVGPLGVAGPHGLALALAVAEDAIPALAPIALAIAVRRLRFDRRALDALGIDAGAPADLAATYFACFLVVAGAVQGAILSDEDLTYDVALVAGWLASTAAIILALRYLRRRLDEGEARRASRAP